MSDSARFRGGLGHTPRGASIKVIGIGGGGGNAVNRMVEAGISGVDLIVVNTDTQALRASRVPIKLQIGAALTKGLGVGGSPDLGRKSAEEDLDGLRELIAGADMLFVTAGMGGGTGTGAAPVVAKLAKEQEILTVGIVTYPFIFEGPVKAKQADAGIKELKAHVDTLLIIQNQRLFSMAGARPPLTEAFLMVDSVLRQAVQAISDVVTMIGQVNVDLNDVKAIMKNSGEAHIGIGEAEGEDRATVAVDRAMNSPLLDTRLDGARGLLVNVTSGEDLGLHEVETVMKSIGVKLSNECNVKLGHVLMPGMEKWIKITVIATGFPPRRPGAGRGEDSWRGPDEPGRGSPGLDVLDPDSIPSYLRKRSRRVR